MQGKRQQFSLLELDFSGKRLFPYIAEIASPLTHYRSVRGDEFPLGLIYRKYL